MSPEISRSKLEAQISQINKEVAQLTAKTPKEQPFSYEEQIETTAEISSTEIEMSPDPENFWSHLLKNGPKLALISIDLSDYRQDPINVDLVDSCQRQTLKLIATHLGNNSRPKDELEVASLEVCLTAFSSFRWAENPGLFLRLNTKFKQLAVLYAARG